MKVLIYFLFSVNVSLTFWKCCQHCAAFLPGVVFAGRNKRNPRNVIPQVIFSPFATLQFYETINF